MLSRRVLFMHRSTAPSLGSVRHASYCYMVIFGSWPRCGTNGVPVLYLPSLCVIMSYLDKCHSFRSMAESLTPARAKKSFWISDLARVLHPYRWICRVSSCRLISIPSSLHHLRPSFCATAPFTKQIPPPLARLQFSPECTYSRAQKSLSPTADIIPYSRR